jgi:polyisoprenoid-binding protein YceI
MVNEFVFGAVFLFLGIVFLLFINRSQTIDQQLKLVSVMGLGVGSILFSHTSSAFDINPKSPLYIANAIIFSSIVFDYFLNSKLLRSLLALILPLAWLLIAHKWFHVGNSSFDGLSILKVSLLASAAPWIIAFILSKLPFNAFIGKQISTALLSLFLLCSILVSIFSGGPFAFFSIFCSFLSAYTLMPNTKKMIIENMTSFLLAFLLFALYFGYHVTEDFSGGTISWLLGSISGILIFSGTFVLQTIKNEQIDKVKWLGINTFVFAFVLLVILLLLLLKPKIGIGGRPSIEVLLLSFAVAIIFVQKKTVDLVFAPSAFVIGLMVLFSPDTPIQGEKYDTEYQKVNFSSTDSALTQAEKQENNLQTIEKDTLQKTKENLTNGLLYKKGIWQLKPKKSSITFVIDALGEKVLGNFNKFSGELNSEKTSVSILIEVNSIDTKIEDRNQSLVAEESFFNSSTYPTIEYEVKQIIDKENNQYLLKGFFTMKGVKKSLSLMASYNEINTTTISLRGKGKLDRTQFNMNPDASMGNEVKFEFKVEFEKK